jgi:hypothetical protein
MSKKIIASVAIAGFVAIGATSKRPHPRHRPPPDDAGRYIKGKFAGGVRGIPSLVSWAATEH